MAHLTQSEFERAVELLAEAHGLDRLRDKFFKLRGLVTRRGYKSAASLAQQLYNLSSGMRREVPANLAFQAIWAEHLGSKLGEGADERFEKLAEGVNSCLDPDDGIATGKEEDLRSALAAYESALADGVGLEVARIDMTMKAVPAIAELLRGIPRTEPLASASPAPSTSQPEANPADSAPDAGSAATDEG